MLAIIPRLLTLLKSERLSSGSNTRLSVSERPSHRRLLWEQCEERIALSTNGTGFVTSLYHDILNRAPDPIGLASYNEELQQGATPESVVTSIWNSSEHRGIQVDGFYQTFLHRAADPDGRQFYVEQLLSGVAEERLMVQFLSSSEYFQLHPGVEAYFTALYQDVLGRKPDSEGLKSWLSEANPSWNLLVPDPEIVTGGFVNSHERHQKLIDSYYENYLGRPADLEGEADWTNLMDPVYGVAVHEESVAIKFLSSDEYVRNHPLN